MPPFQSRAGRTGRGTKPPPQLGQTLASTPSTQSAQKVHSKLQMRASVAAGGSALLQCSQVGLSSSISLSSGSAVSPLGTLVRPSWDNCRLPVPGRPTTLRVSASTLIAPPRAAKPLTGYRPYWAKRFGTAPFLPMSRAEMDALGWDSCDIIIVTGDAYVDHPSFGMAVIGRVLEAQGFRVGIIAQPDWQSAEPFKALGQPNLFFGVTAGNMDSMINRYTADRKIRSDDAYTPGDVGGKRPDRASLVYAQRCREAFNDVPIVLGGIEASLRRIAHYDYWQDKVRRSILVDAKADLLLYGNAERAIVEIAHRLAAREPVAQHHRRARHRLHAAQRRPIGRGLVRDRLDRGRPPGPRRRAHQPVPDAPASRPPRQGADLRARKSGAAAAMRCSRSHAGPMRAQAGGRCKLPPRERTVIRLPAYEQVKSDPVLYAHANRVLHLETNPGNARALVQRHGDRDVWLNPPPIPLTTAEMDHVFDLPYARSPHPRYADETRRPRRRRPRSRPGR